ncbi:hypothetical protein AAY473_036031 [Plecturocebus cupreus]
MKVAGKEAIHCKATEEELPKTMGTHLLHKRDLDVRYEIKGEYFGALRFDCPAGFWTCMGAIAPLFWPISSIWNSYIYPVPVPPLYLGGNSPAPRGGTECECAAVSWRKQWGGARYYGSLWDGERGGLWDGERGGLWDGERGGLWDGERGGLWDGERRSLAHGSGRPLRHSSVPGSRNGKLDIETLLKYTRNIFRKMMQKCKVTNY